MEGSIFFDGADITGLNHTNACDEELFRLRRRRGLSGNDCRRKSNVEAYTRKDHGAIRRI